jgi:hypothetical protein
LAIVFARVSLILVNFGFWVGSRWGDYPGETWAQGRRCSLGGACQPALGGHHSSSVRRGRVSYTMFQRLGAQPWAIIVAGLTIVAFAIVLWRYNLTADRPATVTA